MLNQLDRERYLRQLKEIRVQLLIALVGLVAFSIGLGAYLLSFENHLIAIVGMSGIPSLALLTLGVDIMDAQKQSAYWLLGFVLLIAGIILLVVTVTRIDP